MKNKKAILYCYVSPKNAKRAKQKGRTEFGTFSNYIDYLIAYDHVDREYSDACLKIGQEKEEPVFRKDR